MVAEEEARAARRGDKLRRYEEEARKRALEEIARNQRADAAARSAEWQAQSWSDKSRVPSDANLGTDVEWSGDSGNE